MKRTALATMIITTGFAVQVQAHGDIHAKDVKVSYWGTQERANGHFQGEMTDFKAEVRPQLTDLHKQVDDVKAHSNRNTGLAEANQRRLNEQDTRDNRQDGSIDNAHHRIGGVIEQANKDREVIQANADRSIATQGAAQTANDRATALEGRADRTEQELTGTTARSFGNQKAIGFLQETDVVLSEAIQSEQAARERLGQTVASNTGRLGKVEKGVAGNREQATLDRNYSAGERDRIETESIHRDDQLAQTVNYNARVNEAYQRQSSAQFAHHKAAIESNTQAIASEKQARKEQGKNLSAGVASAIAIGSHMMDVDYQGFQMSMSGGSYRGETAASLAFGGALSDSTFAHISVANDSRGNQAYGANINFKF